MKIDKVFRVGPASIVLIVPFRSIPFLRMNDCSTGTTSSPWAGCDQNVFNRSFRSSPPLNNDGSPGTTSSALASHVSAFF